MKKVKSWWPSAICAIVLLAVLAAESYEYRRERGALGIQKRVGELEARGADVNASMAVVAFDGIRGDLTVRIDLTAPSQAAGLELALNTAQGRVVQKFGPGAKRWTYEATVRTEGFACDYPFDSYRGAVQVECRSVPEGKPLKVSLELSNSLSLLEVTGQPLGAGEPQGIEFHLQRSRLVKGFSVFINAMVCLIGLAILGITSAVAFFERKVEVNKFGFMAGMLFAFPAVRALQPGVPPLGIAMDYFSVFWAQAMAGCGILVCSLVWIFRQK